MSDKTLEINAELMHDRGNIAEWKSGLPIH
jgi:hypothetical protein